MIWLECVFVDVVNKIKIWRLLKLTVRCAQKKLMTRTFGQKSSSLLSKSLPESYDSQDIYADGDEQSKCQSATRAIDQDYRRMRELHPHNPHVQQSNQKDARLKNSIHQPCQENLETVGSEIRLRDCCLGTCWANRRLRWTSPGPNNGKIIKDSQMVSSIFKPCSSVRTHYNFFHFKILNIS